MPTKMKFNTQSLLLFGLFAFSTSGGAVTRRQSSLFGAVGSLALKPEQVKDAPPQIRSTAKRSIARWGPFELPGLDASKASSGHSHEDKPMAAGTKKPMDPNGFLVSKMISEGICTNCTVIVGKAEITYEDGSAAGIDNGVYLHHVLVMDTQKTPGDFAPWCPGNLSTMTPKELSHPVKSIFLSGGVEHFTVWYTTPDGKFDSGYYVKSGPFAMTAEIVNYKATPQKVYITLDYEYMPGKVGADAFSTLLTVTGCSAQVGYFSDQPQNQVMSDQFPILQDGTLINTRGHLHDGGESIALYLNNRLICSSNATYGGVSTASMLIEGNKKWETISKMSDCTTPIEVKRGDYLRMKSIYDTVKHPLRESHGEKMEEMGIYTFTFVPKAGLTARRK